MIVHILFRIGVTVVSIGAIMFLLALSWAGFGYETLVIVVVFGYLQLGIFICCGIADTIEKYEKGRHAK